MYDFAVNTNLTWRSYVKGLTYPEGPWRTETSVQRLQLLTLDISLEWYFNLLSFTSGEVPNSYPFALETPEEMYVRKIRLVSTTLK